MFFEIGGRRCLFIARGTCFSAVGFMSFTRGRRGAATSFRFATIRNENVTLDFPPASSRTSNVRCVFFITQRPLQFPPGVTKTWYRLGLV